MYSAAAKALAVRWALELVLDMGCKQDLMKGDAKLVIEGIFIYRKNKKKKTKVNKKDVNLFKKVGWDIVLLLVDS